MKIPFGKYKGIDVKLLPRDYLQYISTFAYGQLKEEITSVLEIPEEEDSLYPNEDSENESEDRSDDDDQYNNYYAEDHRPSYSSSKRDVVNICGFDYHTNNSFGGNTLTDLSGNFAGGYIPNHGWVDGDDY